MKRIVKIILISNCSNDYHGSLEHTVCVTKILEVVLCYIEKDKTKYLLSANHCVVFLRFV